MLKSVIRLGAVVLAALVTSGRATAGVTFTTIANPNTSIPGAPGTNFSFFLSGATQYDGTNVAFVGSSPGGAVRGAYTSGGAVLFNNSTLVPGSASPFGFFGGFDYVNGNFVAEAGTSSSAPGVFVNSGTSIAKIADTSTTLPGGAVPFTFFSNAPAVSSTGAIAFIGSSNKTSPTSGGIYTTLGGTFHALADTNTLLPGTTSSYNAFAIPSFDGNTVAFAGTSTTGAALLLQTGNNSPTIVANQNTPIPGGTGNFIQFFNPSIRGSHMVFSGAGTNTNDNGVYAVNNGIISLVADASTTIPGSLNTFLSVAGGSTDSDGDVVFFALRNGAPGLTESGFYLSHDGIVSKIIESGDTLDGKTVSSIDTGHDSFANGGFAFHAIFTDGSEGIYLATVPEPATAGFVLAALPVALLCRRRTGSRAD